ncbi:MAG: cupredoxin domain-containing protein [Acidobacteria bacterium]|nr:cupredoxin domain-containing protein [Acidobacteriota bacterium]
MPIRSVGYLLLAMLLCMAGEDYVVAEESVELAVAEDGVQRGSVSLDDFYHPNHLIVRAGKPVELVLKSLTTITPHNFILKEPEAGLNVEEEIGAGKTVTVKFTPTRPGTYTFYCDKRLLFFKSHREKGMEGRLEVR